MSNLGPFPTRASSYHQGPARVHHSLPYFVVVVVTVAVLSLLVSSFGSRRPCSSSPSAAAARPAMVTTCEKNNRGPLSFYPTSAGSGATKGGLPNVPVDIHGLRKWCMAWSCLGCLHFAGLKSLDE